MTLPLFVFSPLPAALSRTPRWNESVMRYDSGERQGQSPYQRPLYDWEVPVKLMTETKQSSLWAFVNGRKGMTTPFLMKDPYDCRVASVLAVRSGITNAATLHFYDLNSYSVRPDTLYIGSMTSALSVYVRLGFEYAIDQDTGILTVNTKATNDVWGVRSLEYVRKVAFKSSYKETSPLWNVFTTQFQIEELP